MGEIFPPFINTSSSHKRNYRGDIFPTYRHPLHIKGGYGGNISPIHIKGGYGGNISPIHIKGGYGGNISPI